MNYLSHYRKLIARAKARDSVVGYVEKHHVLPRCMGGCDSVENIVVLTAEEHFVAHQLLLKIYPSVGGLATAAVLMSKKAKNAKAYGWLRKKNALALSGMAERSMKISRSLLGNSRASALKGRKRPQRSEAWKAKLSVLLRSYPKRAAGEWSPSEATRKRMSDSAIARKRDQRGDANASRKISFVEVIKIRELCASKRHTQKEIAGMFCISSAAVSMIVNRKRWDY